MFSTIIITVYHLLSYSFYTHNLRGPERWVEPGGGWSWGLNSGLSDPGAHAPGHHAHLCVEGAVVSEGFSAADVGARDLRREGRGVERVVQRTDRAIP